MLVQLEKIYNSLVPMESVSLRSYSDASSPGSRRCSSHRLDPGLGYL